MYLQQSRLKFLALGLGILAPLLAVAAPQADPVVARVHFSGGSQLVLDANAANLKKIGELPATVDFRAHVVSKSANVLGSTLGKQLNPANPDSAMLLQPLLDQVISCESVAVFGGRVDAPLGFVVAIHLTEPQATVWRDNLGRLLAAAGEPFTAAGFQGLVWKKSAFRVIRAKEWTVVSRGDDLATQLNEMLANVTKLGRPVPALQGDWLEADADWPRLAAWLPISSCPFKLARTQISLASKNDKIHTTVNLHYPQPLQWTAKPWRVPVEHARDPMISFTAARNVAPFMAPNETLSKLKLNPWNEQIYVWAMETIPIQTLAAIPVDHSTNLLHELATQLPAVFNSKLNALACGDLTELTNHQGITWHGVQPVVPTLRAGSEKSGDFLLGEFMPALPPVKTQPAPSDLFGQFTGRNDLVYYDWELTKPRLSQWRPMAQMLPILRPVPIRNLASTPTSVSPASVPAAPAVGGQTVSTNQVSRTVSARRSRGVWLGAIEAELGSANSITEVAVTGPNDAKLIRNSPLGFTGLELVLLSEWMTEAGMHAQHGPALPVPSPSAPKPKK